MNLRKESVFQVRGFYVYEQLNILVFSMNVLVYLYDLERIFELNSMVHEQMIITKRTEVRVIIPCNIRATFSEYTVASSLTCSTTISGKRVSCLHLKTIGSNP